MKRSGLALVALASGVLVIGAAGQGLLAGEPRQGWFGQPVAARHGKVRVSSDVPGIRVLCLDLPKGKRFLGMTDRPFSRTLPAGVHRLSFVGPGGFRVLRVVTVKAGETVEARVLRGAAGAEVPRHGNAAAKGSPARLRLRVRSIAGTPGALSAVLLYEGRYHLARKGWVAPDGAFRVLEIRPDRVEVLLEPALHRKVFYY